MGEEEHLRRFGLRPGGPDLDQVRRFLATLTERELEDADDAVDALSYLRECEATGDFADFTVSRWAQPYVRYYRR